MSELNENVEMELMVSPICTDDKGEKFAYVSFSEVSKVAEAKIPDCEFTKNQGFTEEELEGLRQYMIANLKELKKMAAQQSVFKAFMK